MAYSLYIKDTDKKLGLIGDEQLEQLIDVLEEEGADDKDYYIDADVLEFMEQQGVDPTVLDMIRPHVNEQEGVEIEWREEIEDA